MRMNTPLLTTAVMLALAAPCVAHSADASADDLHAVQQASAQFYTSLNAMFTGDAAPMYEIWSHADDVSYMGPTGGIQSGWDQVRHLWETQAALHLGGRVEPAELRFTVGHNLAVVQCFERGNNFDAHGQPVQVSIRATNIFRKEHGSWKMIGHHTDLLPFLQAHAQTPAADTEAQAAE